MKLEYPYTLEPQESGGFVVQFPDIEEAFTEGATPEECAFNAAEVLTGILEQRLEDGAEIPLPGKRARRPVASPSAAVQTAVAIHWHSRGRISQERAAQLAGLDRTDFLHALSREGVDAFVVDFDSLRRELEDE